MCQSTFDKNCCKNLQVCNSLLCKGKPLQQPGSLWHLPLRASRQFIIFLSFMCVLQCSSIIIAEIFCGNNCKLNWIDKIACNRGPPILLCLSLPASQTCIITDAINSVAHGLAPIQITKAQVSTNKVLKALLLKRERLLKLWILRSNGSAFCKNENYIVFSIRNSRHLKFLFFGYV